VLTKPLYFGKVLVMPTDKSRIWQSPSPQQLAEALTAITDVQDMQSFLRDVMTKKEIEEISTRLEAARLLKAGAKYSEITEKTKLSSRTVARISDWLQNGTGGYDTALNSVSAHWHMPPVRAD
jgi:TrpR-related protein YerC/YecD